MERPSRQIIARHPEFFLARKNNLQQFSFSARWHDRRASCHVTGLHKTANEVRACPLVNLRPKRKRDVQIFGHDITRHRVTLASTTTSC